MPNRPWVSSIHFSILFVDVEDVTSSTNSDDIFKSFLSFRLSYDITDYVRSLRKQLAVSLCFQQSLQTTLHLPSYKLSYSLELE